MRPFQLMRQDIYDNIQLVKKLIERGEIEKYQGFMYIASLVSENSKDPATKTGACIVDPNFNVISYGFNAPPRGYEGEFSWEKEKKGPLVIHAEVKSIVSAYRQLKDLRNAIMFITLFPCNICAQMVNEAGIKALYYNDAKYYNSTSYHCEEARDIFRNCGVHFEKIDYNEEEIVKKMGGLHE